MSLTVRSSLPFPKHHQSTGVVAGGRRRDEYTIATTCDIMIMCGTGCVIPLYIYAQLCVPLSLYERSWNDGKEHAMSEPEYQQQQQS